MKQQDEYINHCLTGEKLYGDDLDLPGINQWFSDEAEAYANLTTDSSEPYRYYYHVLNERYGYRYLKQVSFNHVLGIGSAFGDELLPIKKRIKRVTILDPSETFSLTDKFTDVDFDYVKPEINGDMLFANGTFDLITCFGVLHHIPNVSHVVRECYRSLAPGGTMLLREPIVSMGDWRQSRAGLTKHERGIPPAILQNILLSSGFTIENRHLCMFPPLAVLARKLGISPFNNKVVTELDALASKLMAWNLTYHRTSLLTKLAPSSVFYVVKKPKAVL